MSKLALAMIVKGAKDEMEPFNRCLENVLPYVDRAFITITHKPGKDRDTYIDGVCDLHNEGQWVEKDGEKTYIEEPNKIVVSDFEWCDDFSKARNFNFAQIPKEYTHILWCDADDVFRGLERLEGIILKNPDADCFGMWYLYHFDEYKQADVVHKKTMVLKNNGFAEWRGRLHEDMIALRDPNIVMIPNYFKEGIDRMHLTEERDFREKVRRNVRISKKMYEEEGHDPRSHINYANSLIGAGKWKKVAKVYEDFIDKTGSDEDKFIAYLRLSEAYHHLKQRSESLRNGHIALGLRPEYPDGYFNLGNLNYGYGNLDDAEKYFLMGLKMKPKYSTIVVYNPRDYDYNPMRQLTRIYSDKGRPDLALPFIKACLEIYPNNDMLKAEFEIMKGDLERLQKLVAKIPEYQKMDDETLKKEMEALPLELRSHPGICHLYNQRFIKTQSNGKELVIYCYPTAFEFNPELFEKVGFGGSEEAVVNLSKHLADLGWEVTVYNNCGPVPRKYGKVWWRPFWAWNHRDVVDRLILWRAPKPLDFELGAKKVYCDFHDVVPEEELTPERVRKVEKIFVKTKAHRSLFPKVPDEKFAVIPNGQDNSLFKEGIERDPYLLINTSSPDRSMDVLPELFREVKKKVPQAKLRWYYGWKNFDDLFSKDSPRMQWKEKIQKEIDDAGIECMGKVPQKDIARAYQEASILAYPSEFFEIDCISVKKAQAAGCIPVTTDFAAFDESVQCGVKIHSKKNNHNWSLPYQMGFGITDEKMKKEWVNAVVKLLRSPDEQYFGPEWAKQFEWTKVAKRWDKILCE